MIKNQPSVIPQKKNSGINTDSSIRYIKFSSKRNFGIELEMNSFLPQKIIVKIISEIDKVRRVYHSTDWQQDVNNNYWHVKFDRSCGDVPKQGGWEVASYVASGYKDVEMMGKVANALKLGGAKLNDMCGYHVHVNVGDLQINQVCSIVSYWCKMESIISNMVPERRRIGEYCKLLGSVFNFSTMKDFGTSWSVVCPKLNDKWNRRFALNLCNYVFSTRKTIELRLPEGTFESDDVKNWIRFFVQLIESRKDAPFPENMEKVTLEQFLEILYLHNKSPFFILSKGLRDLKLWILKRILKHSSDIALTEEARRISEIFVRGA